MLRGLLHCLKRIPTAQPVRGFLGIRGAISAVKAQFDHAISAGPARHNPHTMEMTETELQDEDAHEVQAMIGENPFDLDIMGGDVQAQKNFGTIDNPVLMFSSNVGWRYVMCSGANDEDEGSSHQGVWFILREGPMHRCPACGQCYKLINLKDEMGEEGDYYAEHYAPIWEEEMGEDDEWVQRWSMHNFAEPYPVLHPHQNTEYAYILVNPDDHDRILTDPAYRMQKVQEGHEKLSHMHQALLDIEQKAIWQMGAAYPKVKYTREDYEDLITTEKAIRKLDRIYEKVEKFNKREVLDPVNHARRQKRLEAGKLIRMKEQFTADKDFKLQYQDYYATDYYSDEEAWMEKRDQRELLFSGIFNFKNYEFVQEGTNNPVPAIMNVFDKKVFRFRHRMWNDAPDEHFIRETRMKKRFFDRLKANDPKQLTDPAKVAHFASTGDMVGAINAAMPYREWAMSEAVQQYRDYYESDAEDLKDFEVMSGQERAKFAKVFTDFSAPIKKHEHPLDENFGEISDSDSESGKVGVTGQFSRLKSELYPKAETEGLKQALTELHLPTYREPDSAEVIVDDTNLDELLGEQIEAEFQGRARPGEVEGVEIDELKIETETGSTKKVEGSKSA